MTTTEKTEDEQMHERAALQALRHVLGDDKEAELARVRAERDALYDAIAVQMPAKGLVPDAYEHVERWRAIKEGHDEPRGVVERERATFREAMSALRRENDALTAEASALREEAARLRGEKDRWAVVAAGHAADLVAQRNALAAAERRADEAERRIQAIVTGVGADGFDDETVARMFALKRRNEDLEGRLARVHAASAPESLPPTYTFDDNKHACRLYDALEEIHEIAALPSQEQPAAPPCASCECPGERHRDGDCLNPGCACDGYVPAAPSTPEGEPGYDDADPSRWEPGDVVKRARHSAERRLAVRFTDHDKGDGWDFDDGGRLRDLTARRQHWRRIRRSSEAGTDEASR